MNVLKAKAIIALMYIASSLILFGCAEDPKDIVKSGMLQIDQSLTVGDALSKYQYFGNNDWKSFRDPQGREIVEFNGTFDFAKFKGASLAADPLKRMTLSNERVEQAIKKLGDLQISYVAQFAVSMDGETFEFKYSGLKISVTNKDTGEKGEQEIADQNFQILKNIYSNQPESYTWGLLASAR